MWNTPSKERLDRVPRFYSTESIPLKDKVIALHFFMAGCDWYIVEYDGDDLFFGYAILNGDLDCVEWGYISFSELESLRMGFLEVDCELEEYWGVKKAGDIKHIQVWDTP